MNTWTSLVSGLNTADKECQMTEIGERRSKKRQSIKKGIGGFYMEKFVPYEKMSKKEKKKADASRRGSWGSMSPVTRIPQNSKAYDRKKEKAVLRNAE